jgi:hypothetical protein
LTKRGRSQNGAKLIGLVCRRVQYIGLVRTDKLLCLRLSFGGSESVSSHRMSSNTSASVIGSPKGTPSRGTSIPTSSRKSPARGKSSSNGSLNGRTSPSAHLLDAVESAVVVGGLKESDMFGDEGVLPGGNGENPQDVEVLTNELIKSQSQIGKLDVENKYLLLRLRHQLKEAEATNAKVN